MKKITLFFLMIPFVCMAQQRPLATVEPMTPELTKVVIDTLSKALINNYVFTDKARVMSKYLYAQLAKGAYHNIKDPQAFAQQIAADLQTACTDLHMGFHFDPRLALMGPPPVRASDPRQDSMRNADMAQHNFAFTAAQILPGNVGYVKFNGFVDPTSSAVPTVTAAFRFVRGNQVFKLRYISPGFFQLDENVQVKFGQQRGTASGMQFYWSDGGMTFKAKIR